MSPPQESDVASQISQIEDALAQGVDGIAIAVTDPDALTPVLEKAIADGVPVVYVDTKGNMEGVTFIGTNNEEGAKLAADYICSNVEAGSEVAILQGLITQSTGQARATGSKAGMEACGLNIVAEQPANWDRAEAVTVMENILTGNPNIKAVFASNDNMALGALEALRLQDLLDQVVLVGFDANPNAADAIVAGEMEATIAQNPFNMGYLSVENLIKLVNGETIDPIIDTGTELVDASNAADYDSAE
jgi:ribose transport system substrate-binding protein